MISLYVIRHAALDKEIALTDIDPPLSKAGENSAQKFSSDFHIIDDHKFEFILSSTLKRGIQTANIISNKVSLPLRTSPCINEVPTPGGSFQNKQQWLREWLQGTWSSSPEEVVNWRNDLLQFVMSIDRDAIFISHFSTINALLAISLDSDKILHARPKNLSIWCFAIINNHLSISSWGDQQSFLKNSAK